jgi:Ca2+-binding EF-hand superfamily protein
MPSELKEAFAKFAKDPSFVNQNEVKLQVCKAIGYTEHEAFHDEMFKEIREECRNVTYDMGFDSALESVLTPEDDKKE